MAFNSRYLFRPLDIFEQVETIVKGQEDEEALVNVAKDDVTYCNVQVKIITIDNSSDEDLIYENVLVTASATIPDLKIKMCRGDNVYYGPPQPVARQAVWWGHGSIG